jgi:hypothetical protein
MKTISPAQLVVLLAKIKGARPLTISAFVEAKTNKTAIVERAIGRPTGKAGKNVYNTLSDEARANLVLKENPFAVVRKLSKVNGITGANYEASVNRQQAREGSEPAFEAKERAWGERVSPALVEDKGKWFLAIQPRATSKPVYFTKRADGEPFKHTLKTEIEAFLPPARDYGETQGVEKAVIYRNYSIDNIASITIDGETYRIRHESSAPNVAPVKVKQVKVNPSFIAGAARRAFIRDIALDPNTCNATGDNLDYEGPAQDSEWSHKD